MADGQAGGEKRRENKLGTMPVGRLLLSMSLPMVMSMLVQALYNIVDSIFVARLSEEALTAVSLAFPAQMLVIAVCAGTGVGMNAYLSKSLGERNYDLVNRVAGNGTFLALMSFAFFFLLGVFAVGPFFTCQTDIPSIAGDGALYLRICLTCSLGITMQIVTERHLQAVGMASHAMAVQILGAVTNIILDPILIFGLLGAPALGVTGAAAATAIGQTVAGITGIIFNLKYNKEIVFAPRFLRPDAAIIARIYRVGVPSVIMASVGSIMVFFLNKLLISYSATAAAVLGVYFKLQSFAFMPVFGLNNGMIPIIAFNFGARRPDRIKRTMRLSVAFATSIMIVAMGVFFSLTEALLSLFNASEAMLAIGVPALRKIAAHFVFAGFCIGTISCCQAMGHGFLSLVISAVRGLAVLLPSAYILSALGGLDAIWWSFIIAELASVATCVIILKFVLIKEINALAN